jgi:hypothetical protein
MWLWLGGNQSSVEIFVSNRSDNAQPVKMDSAYGSSNEWRQLVVLIGKQGAGWHVFIKAYPEHNSDFDWWDVAVDDLEFVDCAPGSLIVSERVDCDFEEPSMCGYEMKTTVAGGRWSRKANKSESYKPTGPLADHTTGKYLYIYSDFLKLKLKDKKPF